jgi:hypothetical protein
MDFEPHPVPDLGELDENEQAREIYARAGLALYYAQVFEQGMIHTVYAGQIVNGTIASEFNTAEAFHRVVDSQTAGAILVRLRRHLDLAPELDAVCVEALRLRNFLAHHFFSERSELFFNQEGRRLMLDELQTMIRTFGQADRRLEVLMIEMHERIGLKRETVERIVQALADESRPGGRTSAEVVDEMMRDAHPTWTRD